MDQRKQSFDQIPALHFLRGLAILVILAFHVTGAAYVYDRLEFAGWWPDWHSTTRSFFLFYPITLGWAGVQLFFIVSGFSIHYSTLLHPHRHSTIGFYMRRFWRIVPTYLVVLFLYSFSWVFGEARFPSPLGSSGHMPSCFMTLTRQPFSRSTPASGAFQ